MNRIDKLFKEKYGKILSVYFTAGYPQLNSTIEIIKALEASGVDMVEIGIPFSDPVADGPVIQLSNGRALKNGMRLNVLFSQLHNIREKVKIPLLLMGYLNPVLQFGVENFVRKCKETGIDGVIIPDLPPVVYSEEFLPVFQKYSLYNILLVSPRSEYQRMKVIDKISKGFIYMVSSSSVTGAKGNFSNDQIEYFKRIREMNLHNPCLAGFGISTNQGFNTTCEYAGGGIIGSAFINILSQDGNLNDNIRKFVKEIRG
jgi:tryptophan synthase alpha chain